MSRSYTISTTEETLVTGTHFGDFARSVNQAMELGWKTKTGGYRATIVQVEDKVLERYVQVMERVAKSEYKEPQNEPPSKIRSKRASAQGSGDPFP